MRFDSFVLFPAVALALALSLGLLAGAAGGPPRPAEAAIDCDTEYRLRVDFIDDDTDDLLAVGGAEVRITPDPRDGIGSRSYVDQGASDDNLSATGRIHEDAACKVTAPDQYSILVESLPAGCDLVGSPTQTTALAANATVTFHVDNCLDADDVDIQILPDRRFLGCSQRTDIHVEVEIENATAPDGTEVSFSTNLGSVSPSSDTTSGGKAMTDYRAPAGSGGTATIRVTVLGVSETTTIAVGCNLNVGPAGLGFPQTTCSSSSANVTFYWGSNHAGTQFLDLTLYDNDFVWETFVHTSGLSSATERYTWNGLVPGIPHFWRINTLTDAGWVTSATGTFVPCGGPQIRRVTYACTGGGRALVTFHWSPGTPAGRTTWLDLSLFNDGFRNFINAGPMGHEWLNWTWPGILANQTHYWRVSTLYGGDWARSSTGSFVAYC